jgi:uncharacterized membrane protein YhfC
MDIVFYTHILNVLLMVAIPIILGIILVHRFHLSWSLWGIGAAGFVISQIGHIPFNSVLTWFFQQGIFPQPPEACLSAGLWEELTRFFVFKIWAKNARTWRKGVLLGAGHGGIEAVLFGLIAFYAFLTMVNLRNADLSQLVPEAQLALARLQVNTYWSAPWPSTLLGAAERLLTVPCQIALSVLVLQAFTRRKFYWVGLAILWHTAIDAVSVYFLNQWSTFPWGIYAVEGLVAAAALISMMIIYLIRQPEPSQEPPMPSILSPDPPVKHTRINLKETEENITDTRYQ